MSSRRLLLSLGARLAAPSRAGPWSTLPSALARGVVGSARASAAPALAAPASRASLAAAGAGQAWAAAGRSPTFAAAGLRGAPRRALHGGARAAKEEAKPAAEVAARATPGGGAGAGKAATEAAGSATPAPGAAGGAGSAAVAVLQSARSALERLPALAGSAIPARARAAAIATQAPGAVRRVISLQLTALWRNHGGKLLILGGSFVAYASWRVMYGIATSFVSLSETMAELGFLALAVSGVLLTGLYVQHRITIKPSSVYRLSMVQLNSHPGLLEVMGAPLVGSNLRASVLSGGDVRFRGLVPKLRSRRLHMIFPLSGSERRGLVSVEAKKRHGRYDIKLLAVDVPTAAGRDQRIFVLGNARTYERGGVLGELRDPFLRTLSMEDVWAREDDAEDEEAEGEKLRRKAGGEYFGQRLSRYSTGVWNVAADAWRRARGALGGASPPAPGEASGPPSP